MRRTCQNRKTQTGCEYYSECFFDNSKPHFKPSDDAILRDVFKRNADGIKAYTKEEQRVLDEFKEREN